MSSTSSPSYQNFAEQAAAERATEKKYNDLIQTEWAIVPTTFLVTHTKQHLPGFFGAEGSYSVEGVFVSAVHADEAIQRVHKKQEHWVVSEMKAFECETSSGAVLDLACVSTGP
jgi:hypothetical protein